VRATRFNHVSISADDLERSARFYEEVFGMERLPTPVFEAPVVWLRLGDQQLHLFQRDTRAPAYHHIALDVDDFEAVYLLARERGLLDSDTWESPVREHPAGWVQMYIRDPGGNLVEVDWPDASTLDRSVVRDIVRLDKRRPQIGDAATATLYHSAATHAVGGRTE
jgi:catechol 2,3-dioxygenase-like lactoylglutathione lyase family enzyme